MCLLTLILENAELDYKDAKEAAISNPDGFGFAIHTQVGIIYDKDMDFEKLWLRWTDLRQTYKNVSLWHFRITTHGNTDINNCHPFVTNDGKCVLAHNGILPLTMPIGDARSDTRLFTEVVLPALGGVHHLDDVKNFEALEKWAGGNKLVILSSDPTTKYDWYIVNEGLGHWKNNVWFSNASYKRYVYASAGYNYLPKNPYKSSYLGSDSDEDWGMWERDVEEAKELALEENPMALWEDQQDYLEDELYPDEKIFGMIKTFTEYLPDVGARATCYECGCVYYYDPETEFTGTHCGECKKCMACNNEVCSCWDNFEYGINYFHYQSTTSNVKLLETEKNDQTQTKQQTTQKNAS